MTKHDATLAGDVSTLFRPFKLGALELKNRIVMAPMTRVMAPGGIPGQANAAYYRRRAEGDVGLILSEGTVVNRSAARNEQDIPVFHGEAALAGWKTVIDTVHAVGGRMGPQLWHVGAVPSQKGWKPEGIESPSGLLKPDTPLGQAMTEADIEATIAAFAQSAADAKRLGFDVAEIHGAHGYLIDEFFWAGTNLRTDAWGGKTLPERARFAVAVVKAVRAAVGPDFPILFRVSQWKQQDLTVKLAQTPDEMTAWLAPLAEAGVDVFHCSQRRFWEPEFAAIDGADGLNFAGWVKKLIGKPTISVGSVGLSGDMGMSFSGQAVQKTGLEQLLARISRDEFDLIAVGRALISNPNWAALVQGGESAKLKAFDVADLGSLH